MRSWKHLGALESKPLTEEVLSSQDAVILVTDHTAVDYDFVLEHARLLIDTRGVHRQPNPKVVRA
jgi:UDP-N-acetyl-D-glucosamine dehydrogenase